jgi:hypothetical protein
MALDIFAVGPPSRGLFLIGKHGPTHKAEESPSPGTEPKASPSASGKTPLQPYMEALHNMDLLERARRTLAPLGSAPGRKVLGSQIDLKA